MRKVKPYCPGNGSHGIPNGACSSFPVDDCLGCGETGLNNLNRYCPSCFICLSCYRTIKRKFENNV